MNVNSSLNVTDSFKEIPASAEHYLDNSATTPVLPAAAQKAVELMTENFGNPSSLHKKGFLARQAVEAARAAVAERLSAKPEELIFTSGGTEANNLAVFGAVNALRRRGSRIVTTMIEHDSVLGPMKELERQGFEVVFLKPDGAGNISGEQLEAAIDERTIFVSVMLVNNETGAILPVERAARAIRRKKLPALLHTDAVQAFGKLDFSPQKLGADLVTVSAHKVHGPKGTGALYVRKGARILPHVFGGGQEKGLRSGTESAPLIAAFGEAARALPKPSSILPRIEGLNRLLREKLVELPGVCFNSPQVGDGYLPYVLSFSAGAVRAETMLHFLSERGVYVSSGSACGKAKPSHVLEAMGLPGDRVGSSLRASFSRFTTEEDILALAEGIAAGLQELRS